MVPSETLSLRPRQEPFSVSKESDGGNHTRMGARTETIRCATEIRSAVQEKADGVAESVLRQYGRQYGLTSAFVVVALLVSLALQPLFPHPFLFLFFAAVVASAWFGGMLPGLFSVLISTLVADYFFIAPVYSFAVKTTEVSYFAAFVICSLV